MVRLALVLSVVAAVTSVAVASAPTISSINKDIRAYCHRRYCPSSYVLTASPTTTLTVTRTVTQTVTRTTARPTSTQVLPTPVLHDALLLTINEFRQRVGVHPLALGSEAQMVCARENAKHDAIFGFHASFSSPAGSCVAPSGQCECKGTTTGKGCVQLFIDEGPGGPHYEIMRSPRHKAVAYGSSDDDMWCFNFYS